MDKRFIILGVICVVLLIAFGNNPLQQGTQDVPKDPFQQSLQDRLALQNGMGGGTSQGFPMGTQAGGSYNNAYTAPEPVGGAYPSGVSQVQPASTWPTPPPQPAAQAPAPFIDTNAPPQQPQVPAFYLTDGRRIFFSGFKVFTLNSDGSLQILPDGKYTLRGGSGILIQGGTRQAMH